VSDTAKRVLKSSVVLGLGAAWEFLNHWSLLDAVLTKLKEQGAIGVLIANLIVSPVLRLTLIGIGLVLIVKAYYAPETKGEAVAGRVQRDFVTKEITPKYLSDFYRDHTSLQADALVKPLLGQWMRVSGSYTFNNSGLIFWRCNFDPHRPLQHFPRMKC
jgi:hypothetical protein